MNGRKYKEYLLFRPTEDVIDEIVLYIQEFWNRFSTRIDVIREYLGINENPAAQYRNNQGGNILFRPVVLTEYIKAVLEVTKVLGGDSDGAFERLNSIKMDLSETPWKGVLWDGRKMITRADKKLIMLLVLHMCGKEYLKSEDKQLLVDKYISAINYEGEKQSIIQLLNELNNTDAE